MIHDTAIIHMTGIGEQVYIGAYCLIGEPAENRATWPNSSHYVEIQDGAILCGLVTVDAGTVRNTVIGKRSMLMKGVHVGHDAIIGEDCTLACGAKIGGHVVLGRGVNIGLNAVIHPRVTVPQGCMIGAGAVVTKTTEMKPFCCYVGNPARFLRWNQKAIDLAGLTMEQVTEIQNKWVNRSFLDTKDGSTFEEFVLQKMRENEGQKTR